MITVAFCYLILENDTLGALSLLATYLLTLAIIFVSTISIQVTLEGSLPSKVNEQLLDDARSTEYFGYIMAIIGPPALLLALVYIIIQIARDE